MEMLSVWLCFYVQACVLEVFGKLEFVLEREYGSLLYTISKALGLITCYT